MKLFLIVFLLISCANDKDWKEADFKPIERKILFLGVEGTNSVLKKEINDLVIASLTLQKIQVEELNRLSNKLEEEEVNDKILKYKSPYPKIVSLNDLSNDSINKILEEEEINWSLKVSFIKKDPDFFSEKEKYLWLFFELRDKAKEKIYAIEVTVNTKNKNEIQFYRESIWEITQRIKSILGVN
ncbi:MAG: hypothetical protein SFU98_08365 [Leptospiraceae bacterium]|nr:hypothetical protein [Leptospiraceae bacterium]